LVTPYQRLLLDTADAATARKDEQNLLADLIICNSEFVRRSFLAAGFPPERLAAVPSPFPRLAPRPCEPQGSPLVFLHAGTLSLRKGTHVLLEAWRRLGARSGGQLWLVGNNELPAHALRGLPDSIQVRPRVPRSQMRDLFAQSAVVVLPTLGEGRANVIVMAMAHGLPVITTPNAGCDDAVRDGETGWLVPIRDPAAVAEKLAWCLEHGDSLHEMGRAAARQAAAWQGPDFAHAHGQVIRAFLRERGLPHTFTAHVPLERMLAE
jgi:glycosyltransferase involved in cell wall biosynthesis